MKIRYLISYVLLLCAAYISAQTSPETEQKLDQLVSQSDQLINRDWQLSKVYIDSAITYPNKIHYSGIFELYYTAAKVYEGVGKYETGIAFADSAIWVAKTAKDSGRAMYNRARITESDERFEAALQQFLEAKLLFEKIGDSTWIGRSVNGMAFVYRAMKQYDQATEMFRESASYCNPEDLHCFRRSKFNIGLMYLETDRYEEAIPQFRQAVSGLDLEENLTIYGMYYNNMANCFEKLLHINPAYYDSALFYGRKNLQVKKRIKNPRKIALAHNGLAATFERSSTYDSSLYHAGIAYQMADSLDVLQIKRNALSYVITAKIGLKELSNLNDYFEDYIVTVRDLNEQAFSESLSEMATKYQSEQKELENQKLKAQATVNQLIIHQQRQINLLLLIGAIVALGFIGVLYYLYSLKQKINKQLTADKLIIEQQSRELSKLNELKSKFFANISHELRTPLTLIQGNLDSAMQANGIGGQSKEKLKKVRRSSRQLALMVNDLLDLSKLELDSYQLQKYPTDLSKLLSRTVASFSSMAENRNIAFALETDEEGACSVIDPIQFEKVINNLIYNAFKFTEDGGKIHVSLQLDNDEIKISVKDTGMGIPSNDLPYLFDRFYQSDQHQRGGTGLGLSIAKELIELMDGRLEVESEWGKGSVFTITLPASDEIPVSFFGGGIEEALFPERESPVTDTLEIPSNAKILVAEDNPEIMEYLSGILSDHFELHKVQNGKEALAELEKFKPDLILTDLLMPELNGFELIEKVKESPSLANIPVVILTAVAENDEKLKGLRMGIDEYITKPFDPEELLVKVTNLIRNLRNRANWAKEFKEAPSETVSRESNELVLAIRQYVLDNMSQRKISIPQIARHLGMSERQLYRKVGLAIGMKPNKLILEIRLQHARELLTTKSYESVAAISSAVGFDAAPYFSKLYFERFGKKPADYFS